MRNEMSIEIDRPIEEVFDYTINHVAEWSLTVIRDEVIEEQPGIAGTTFLCVTEERGRQMEFHGIVTLHEPPNASAAYFVGQLFDIDVEYLFEDYIGRTRVTQRTNVIGKGFLKVMFFMFGWLMKSAGRKAGRAEFESLKSKLESGAASYRTHQPPGGWLSAAFSGCLSEPGCLSEHLKPLEESSPDRW